MSQRDTHMNRNIYKAAQLKTEKNKVEADFPMFSKEKQNEEESKKMDMEIQEKKKDLLLHGSFIHKVEDKKVQK